MLKLIKFIVLMRNSLNSYKRLCQIKFHIVYKIDLFKIEYTNRIINLAWFQDKILN